MRIAVISDIHANVEALRAVLRGIRRTGIRKVHCLGDLVGRHAFPVETLALLRAGGTSCVAGNQDLVAIGRLDADTWEPRTRRAMSWTRHHLTPPDTEFLSALPLATRIGADLLCVHSTMDNVAVDLSLPWQFYEESLAIRRRFPDVRVCFSGHTPNPQIVEITAGGEVFMRGARPMHLDPASFYFVNPGSVGSPTDGDYRACYAIYDDVTRRVSFHRTTYDRLRVVQENLRQGLPSELGISRVGYIRARAVAAARSIRTRIFA